MSSDFPPTRTAALEKLARFVPHAGAAYAKRRNYDLGAGRHQHVSTLSPYLRHRLITEAEVLEAVLARHSLHAAEKFVQEVFWRTYWKGWLEMRPGVWTDYLAERSSAWNAVQTQSGLRARWEEACEGRTGIEAFDTWAQELADTGYLHNHARMWFASIWIFTLNLPWALGADFLLRHLLDGDAASNTLSWRWVAGVQTKGKTYLARPSNIAKYTEGRFHPENLAPFAQALPGADHPPRQPLTLPTPVDPTLRTGLLITPEDLSPGFVVNAAQNPVAVAMTSHRARMSHLHLSHRVLNWERDAMADMATRWRDQLGEIEQVTDLTHWVQTHQIEQIVTADTPVGVEAQALEAVAGQTGVRVARIRRAYDSAAWPHATHGFFRFKEKIPRLVADLKGLKAA